MINTRYTIVLFSAIFCIQIITLNIFAQTSIKYTYDDSGNRTEKALYIGGEKKSESSSDHSESIKSPEEEEQKVEETLAETNITFYPNPTEGRLKVQIENAPEGEVIRLYVHDINGRAILNMSHLIEVNDIDLTSQPPGTYFMTIIIGNQRTKWKVIKQ
jgi:hypothetical protein